MCMAENGNGDVAVGMQGRGDSRQVRNSTGPPGVGGGSERAYPWDWNNTGIRTPEERWGLRQTKTARAAQEPEGRGRRKHRCTAFQASSPSGAPEQGERTWPAGSVALPSRACACACVCVCVSTHVCACV